MIGGFFSDVATKYPGVFPHDGLFARYPYLFPCVFASALSLLGGVAGYFFLEESLTPPPKPIWEILFGAKEDDEGITASARGVV